MWPTRYAHLKMHESEREEWEEKLELIEACCLKIITIDNMVQGECL